MDYQLAKELKDAGYDQTVHGGHIADGPHHPTLEELIEACGRRVCLYVNGDLAYATIPADGAPRWAEGYKGPTPTEAVARLWLALNKK